MNSWISSAVIYQVNLRSFAAREPRNPAEASGEEPVLQSPLEYLTCHLPHIVGLGATVLYLMPPYLIGQLDRKGIGSPYASRDFLAVDPEYGTVDQLAQLVRAAHANGLRVILDIPCNHTGRDHAWTHSHPDFYVRRDDGGLHFDSDWSDTAKLEYRNPALRRAMMDVFDFWLSLLGRDADGQPCGVDGFRLDMAHFINDCSFWDVAIPWLRARHPGRDLLFLAECYGAGHGLDLLRRGVDAVYDDDFYKFVQHFYAVDERECSVLAESSESGGEAGFQDRVAAFRAGGIAAAAERTLLRWEQALPAGPGGPWLARYVDNHDEGRGLYRFGEGAVRAVMQLTMLSGHCIPLLLAGQEFGAMNRPSIHERIGPCDKGRRRASAVGARHEAGIEFEGNLFARTAEKRLAWHRFYRELIALRRMHRELRDGSFHLLDAGEQAEPSRRAVLAFERRLEGSAMRCAVNLGPEPRQLQNAALFGNQGLYGALRDSTLEAFSAVVCQA